MTKLTLPNPPDPETIAPEAKRPAPPKAKAKRKRSPKPERAVDISEQRWQHNKLVPGEVPGTAYYNATSTVLDAYREARVISEPQYEAGDKLRTIWTDAGRDPRLVVALDERVDRGDGDISFAQAAAWGVFKRVMFTLSELQQSVAYAVCCVGEPADKWARRKGLGGSAGVVVLRDALDTLRKNV